MPTDRDHPPSHDEAHITREQDLLRELAEAGGIPPVAPDPASGEESRRSGGHRGEPPLRVQEGD